MLERYAVSATHHDQTFVVADDVDGFYTAKLFAFGYAAVHLRNFHPDQFLKAMPAALSIPDARTIPFEWQCPLCDVRVRIVHP